MNIQPLTKRVSVKPAPKEEKIGGIIIPVLAITKLSLGLFDAFLAKRYVGALGIYSDL